MNNPESNKFFIVDWNDINNPFVHVWRSKVILFFRYLNINGMDMIEKRANNFLTLLFIVLFFRKKNYFCSDEKG